MTTLFESMTSAGTSSSSATPSLDLLEDSLENANKGSADEGKSETNSATLVPQKATSTGRSEETQEASNVVHREGDNGANPGIAATVRNEDSFANGDGDSSLQYQYAAVAATDTSATAAGAFSVADPHGQMPAMRVVHVNVDQNQAANSSAVHINNAQASVAYSLGGGAAGGAGNVANVFQAQDNNTGVQQVSTVTVDNQGDGSRYTYYPAVQTSEGNAQPGPFYVMVSPQEMIPVSGANVTPPRIIAPRAHSIGGIGDGGAFTLDTSEQTIPVEFRKVESGGRSSRDERRRATHNEVERRRRDKINTWITKLATVVPECQLEQAKQGQMKRQDDTVKSKGGILSKTVDYILKLRQTNERLTEAMKDHENVLAENRVLRQQNEDLRRENTLLHANLQLQQEQVNHGQETAMES